MCLYQTRDGTGDLIDILCGLRPCSIVGYIRLGDPWYGRLNFYLCGSGTLDVDIVLYLYSVVFDDSAGVTVAASGVVSVPVPSLFITNVYVPAASNTRLYLPAPVSVQVP